MHEDYGLKLRRQPRPLTAVAGQRFDYVITLCDKVREFPRDHGSALAIHWSLPDPAAAAATDQASYPEFRRIATELNTRIDYLLPVLTHLQFGGMTHDNRHDRTGQRPLPVDDVDTAVDFDTSHPDSRWAARGTGLRRSHPWPCGCRSPGSPAPARAPMPDGAIPVPGGCNRIHLIVDDITAEIDRQRVAGPALPQRHHQRSRRPSGPVARPRRQPHRPV